MQDPDEDLKLFCLIKFLLSAAERKRKRELWMPAELGIIPAVAAQVSLKLEAP
jgi:hypothetical protein